MCGRDRRTSAARCVTKPRSPQSSRNSGSCCVQDSWLYRGPGRHLMEFQEALEITLRIVDAQRPDTIDISVRGRVRLDPVLELSNHPKQDAAHDDDRQV